MTSPRSRKEYIYVDHSAVYFENEKLADRMRQQVDILCKDKHRAFLSRQAKISIVLGNLDKLQAFRQSVSNTASHRLTATLNNSRSKPKENRANKKPMHRESNKKYLFSDSCSVDSKRVKTQVEINQSFDIICSPPAVSEKIPCVAQNVLINLRFSNQTKNRCVRSAWDKKSPTEEPNRMSASDNLRPNSGKNPYQTSRVSGTSDLEQQKSAPLRKTSSRLISSSVQGDSQVLKKRPSSCKEQWAGLAERMAYTRNYSATPEDNWSRFRPAGTTRICTVGNTRGLIGALTLRRLREIYTLEEPEVGMSGFRRSEIIQHLLLLNQKRNQTLQKKVRNFLEELGDKRRKMSLCTKASISISKH